MDNKANKKTEEILSSLDGLAKATAPDFFYTRLKARMEKGLEPGTRKLWIWRPAYALAALVLLMVLNAAILLQGQGRNENSDNNNIADAEAAQSIAAEYSLNDNNTVYDLNFDK